MFPIIYLLPHRKYCLRICIFKVLHICRKYHLCFQNIPCLCICVFNVFSFSSPPLCHDANTIAGQQDSGLRHNHRLITNATKLSFSFVSISIKTIANIPIVSPALYGLICFLKNVSYRHISTIVMNFEGFLYYFSSFYVNWFKHVLIHIFFNRSKFIITESNNFQKSRLPYVINSVNLGTAGLNASKMTLSENLRSISRKWPASFLCHNEIKIKYKDKAIKETLPKAERTQGKSTILPNPCNN